MWMKPERLRERARMIREWEKYAKRIADAAARLGEGVEVYAFGSAVRGEATAASDIDMLVVVNRAIRSLTERNRLRMMVEEAALLPTSHPFEIHIVARDEASAYFRHAGSDITQLEA